MTEVTVLEIAKQALIVGLEVSGPLLLVSLVVGTVIGILMAATQVQEFTLTFVPKLLALGLVLMLAGPFMMRSLITFATTLLNRLPSMAP
jgi:flagellar biosynthetic protein FliQ